MSVSNQARRRGEILDEIMRYHRRELPKRKRNIPLADVRALAAVTSPARDFAAALRAPGVSLIAECKKASPSRGLMVRDYDAAAMAKLYERGGAAAISVLTDGRHFQGSLADLRDVKEAVGVPVLRKDFIFDPYQVYESRAAGADALLLIAAVLAPAELGALLVLSGELGMSALVEVHTEMELAAILPLRPAIIGVNNRNLQTFEVDFANTARLRAMIPANVITVGESGLQSAADVAAMASIGVDAILVGEHLVRSKNVLARTQEFVRAGRVSGS